MSVCRRPCEEDCEGFEGRPVQKCGVQEAQLEQVLLKLGMALEEAQNAATQPCFSAGVLCNEDGYISHLDLGFSHLAGEVPAELGNLSHLEYLDLRSNQLRGPIPKELGRLKDLESLSLAQNQLSGPIPAELSELKSLTSLDLSENRLTGPLDAGLGSLAHLEKMVLTRNQLTGPIPPELGQLMRLHELGLSENQLTGRIPGELGRLKNLESLSLGQNQLTGEIPHELRLLKRLELLDLSENQLSGALPAELGELEHLDLFAAHGNQLSGAIPAALGKLQKLRNLYLNQNQFTGEIPPEFGQFKVMESLSVSRNLLTGEIPRELGQLDNLQELFLYSNRFTTISVAFNSSALRLLDASRNHLRGVLGMQLMTPKLQILDLSHNKLAGEISSITDYFCALNPRGGVLQELRLNHNKLTGQLPPCLMKFENLTFLALNDNRFTGTLPEIEALELAVLTLHRNGFTGFLPKTLYSLRHLGVLTLHENSIGGSIDGLNLSVPCLDNSRFRIFEIATCQDCFEAYADLTSHQLRQAEANCPKLFNTCPTKGLVNVTLHRNRFSCAIPNSISNMHVSGLVMMGNMLGDGSPLNAPWISKEEHQPFLYYSPNIWKSNVFILTGLSLMMTILLVCQLMLRRRLQELSRRLDLDARARVVSSSLALIKAAVFAFLLASPLLLIFYFGGKYYNCNPPLLQITAADFYAEPLMELGVIICWCSMQLFFCSISADIPKPTCQKPKRVFSYKRKLARLAVWSIWICIVSILSLPSIFYTFAQSTPAENAWELDDNMLKFFHKTAAVQAVIIDMVLAVPISSKFSKLTGVKADRLLMTFRLFSAWLLALLVTTALNENCLGGWKLAWRVCRQGSVEHNKFNWRIYDEEILNTSRDLCKLSETWWFDGRCSRAIVGSLTPFLLQKLLTRSTLQPLVLWFLWHFSRLEPPGDPREGQHRRLFGVWPKTTKSLLPLQQMALLTTQMELLMFWSPYVPLLCLGILAAAVTNLLMFDLGTRVYHVELPSDVVNEGAALSASYLRLALRAGSLFQLWHAFSTQMFGRYLLLAVHLAVLGPWAKCFLPVSFVKRRLWSLTESTEAQLIELTRMESIFVPAAH